MRYNTRRASSWSRDYIDLPHQELSAMVGRLLFSLLQLCRQDFMPTYFLPQHFLPPFCQSDWLREPIMRLWCAGVLRRCELDVVWARSISLSREKVKKNLLYMENRLSYYGMRCIFHVLFDSEADLEGFDFGSFTNTLFEKSHRARLINSIYCWTQGIS